MIESGPLMVWSETGMPQAEGHEFTDMGNVPVPFTDTRRNQKPRTGNYAVTLFQSEIKDALQ